MHISRHSPTSIDPVCAVFHLASTDCLDLLTVTEYTVVFGCLKLSPVVRDVHDTTHQHHCGLLLDYETRNKCCVGYYMSDSLLIATRLQLLVTATALKQPHPDEQ